MNEDELRHLRERIQHDQTSCRCGHLLAACADCRGWLVDHSPRIVSSWRWFVDHLCWSGADWLARSDARAADLAEEHNLGVYLARRFLA